MKRRKQRGHGMSATLETSEPEINIACSEFVEIITDYLEGVLDPAMVSAVEAHLKLCDGCDEYLAQMRTTIKLLGRVPLNTLSIQAKTDLIAAFRGFAASPGG